MSLLDFFGVTEPEALALNPSDDRYYEPNTGYVSARPTLAGVRVDEGTAFNYSVCWAATRLLAGTAGWLPFNLYKKLPSGGAEIDSTHPVHRLIHRRPNKDMGSMMFRGRGVNHQVNWGNCFAEIIRTNGGTPVSLEPIHPWRIPPSNIRRDDDGSLVYLVYRPNGVGQPQRVKQENMFHVPSIISDDGIIGKGVIANAREAIGKAIGTQRRGASAINHGGAPPLALKGAKFKTKEDQQDFRRQINEVHGGPDNAGKWLLLPTDTEVQMLGFSLEDSQFIESEQFDIEEVARWYGVPPHLVGHLLRATFNNIEELGVSFVRYSLIQWLKLWEQETASKLLTLREQETHYAKFVVDALERGNLANRTEAAVKKFFNGHWTLNDWAEKEDMNPVTETVEIDGETKNLGDIRFVQQAMIPLAMAAKGPQQAAPVEGVDQGVSSTEVAKQKMEAYGIGVRAGAITPQLSDEESFRAEAGLPPLSEDVKQAWTEDKGIRRPITLRDPNEVKGQRPGQPPLPDDGEEKPPELAVVIQQAVSAGLSTIVAAFQSLQTDVTAGLDEQRQLTATVDGLSSSLKSVEEGQCQLSVTVAANQAAAVESQAQINAKLEAATGTIDALAAKCDDNATSSARFHRQLSQALLKDVLCRLLSVEIHNAKNMAQTASKFDARLMAFYDEKHRRTMELALLSPVAAALAAAGKTDDPALFVRSYIDGHVAESMQQLLAVCDCQADELPARVETAVAKWHEERTTILIGE